MVCAILAGLKAGKIYVPLDATHPRARIAAILRETQGCLLVTDAANLPLAESLLESAGAAADGAMGRPMNISALPDDLPIENPGLTIPAAPCERHLLHLRLDGRPQGCREGSPDPASPGGVLHAPLRHRAGRPPGAGGFPQRGDV